MGLFPGFLRVEEQERFVGVVLLIDQADQVCDDLAVFLIVNTADGLVARIGDLFCVLGQFDLRNEFSGFLILNGSQLVYAAEGRTVFGGWYRHPRS